MFLLLLEEDPAAAAASDAAFSRSLRFAAANLSRPNNDGRGTLLFLSLFGSSSVGFFFFGCKPPPVDGSNDVKRSDMVVLEKSCVTN